MKGAKKGFTLVELAIVMVIIGILIGAILKGQQLINNARVKRLQNDMRGLEAAMWSFYDRYGRFPGDCNRDGLIDATVYNAPGSVNNSPSTGFCRSTSTDTDPDRPYAELKAARLLSSSAHNRDLARNVFNGAFYLGRAQYGGVYYNVIAIVDIPCFAAKSIDTAVDGSLDAGAGRIRELTSTYTFRHGSNSWTSCTSEDKPIDIVYLIDKTP